MRALALALAPLLALVACASSGPALPANVGTTVPSGSAAPPPMPAPRTVDPKAVAAAIGGTPEVQDGGVVKVSFPRTDVDVQVDGFKMPPFMGLTSWVAFTGGVKPDVEAMIMGDLVLFEDEVSPAMSALLDAGVEVTALHNHFFHDAPKVYFLHVGGEGSVKKLGEGVAKALAVVKDVRAKTPIPADRFGPAPPPSPSAIDAAKLDGILGVKGATKDGMYKATMGRVAEASCGCKVGKAMGVNTWAAFAGNEADAVVDGDFAVTEKELQPVLRSLRNAGVHVVAIHHHMSGETPRILFLHYWGRGPASDLARTIKRTLDLTAWDAPQK